jgi:hypothetical protein
MKLHHVTHIKGVHKSELIGLENQIRNRMKLTFDDPENLSAFDKAKITRKLLKFK